MRTAIRISCLIIPIGLFTGSVCAQVVSQPKFKTYALVVGISDYQNDAIPRLNYADKDARLFAEWLQSKAGGSVPGYQVEVLLNKDATIAKFYDELDWLKTQAKQDDLVYIYFSGHGDIETRDTISQGYLLAWNSPPNNYRNNAISVADINKIAETLTTLNKAKVILITDACHSGKMAGDFYKGRQLTAANLRLVLNNQVRLASCEAGEEAAEGPAWGGGRGVFSYYLLNGLNGMAPPDSTGAVRLGSLQNFLDTAFRTDPALAAEKHKQHPVVDGSPIFPIAVGDPTNLVVSPPSGQQSRLTTNPGPAGLQSLKNLGRQPIDFFFAIAQTAELDTALDFKNYLAVSPRELPGKIVADYLQSLRTARTLHDSLMRIDGILMELSNTIVRNGGSDSVSQQLTANKLDSIEQYRQKISLITNNIESKAGYKDSITLQLLLDQLQNNKYIVARFNEKFAALTHAKTQDMINAYLAGDLAELEKRQYYFAGSRHYRDFMHVVDVAIKVTEESSYLKRILGINRLYLSGLVDRLEMATGTKSDSLLRSAMNQQQSALQLEPYAAYIYNEIGNLYIHRKLYDSAAYHFDYALILAPSWAVPWSNKIRLNLAVGNLQQAKEAIRIAESLQPNLGYVNVNAGLVMEKDSNWIAAEAYYLRAIEKNNVHYLPFERLGLIYIHIGKYAQANAFLLEAKKRKDLFAVNEAVFAFGIELGGSPENWPDEEKFAPSCDIEKDARIRAWKPMLELVKILAAPDDSIPAIGAAEKLLQQFPGASPASPLLHHHIGRKHFQQKNLARAETHIKEAMYRYLPAAVLDSSLRSMLQVALLQSLPVSPQNRNAAAVAQTSARADTSCLLKMLNYYHYNILDDYYLLAAIYEQQKKFDEALNMYTLAADKENDWLMQQAIFQDYKPILPVSDEAMMELEKATTRYEKPVKMGGTLKSARLLEQLGKYEAAENILLKQVDLNRKAGYARQEEMDKGNFGPAGRSPFNFFWLKANYDLEAETHNFYARILKQFPREGEWYRKAGLFLYERLKLTYSRVPVKEQKAFYEFSMQKAYPFKGGESGPTEEVDNNGRYFIETNKIKISATGEEIDISMKAYDPLATGLSWLQLADRFSGEQTADHQVLEAITNLHKWMGNIEAAVKGYQSLLKIQPGNDRLRQDFVELLEANNYFPAAATELDILNRRITLTREQATKLAYYQLLSNQSEDWSRLLNLYPPADAKQKTLVTAFHFQELVMEGEIKKALDLYKDSIGGMIDSRQDQSSEDKPTFFPFDDFLYTKARLLAMNGQNKMALRQIKILIDSGFNYQQVLLNDPALARSRKSRNWRRLMQGYDFTASEDESNVPRPLTNYNTIHYRIPGSRYNPALWD